MTPGTLMQLTGPNGSGKTSLLRIVAGLMPPERGEVRWDGANVRSLKEEYAERITYIGHRNGVKEELTSLENLRISSAMAGSVIDEQEAQDALGRLGLAGRQHLPARFLSEGQRRRSALARLLTTHSVLWLLDEVLASLDEAARNLIESIIGEHLERGGMAIVATHHDLQITPKQFHRLDLTAQATGGVIS